MPQLTHHLDDRVPSVTIVTIVQGCSIQCRVSSCVILCHLVSISQLYHSFLNIADDGGILLQGNNPQIRPDVKEAFAPCKTESSSPCTCTLRRSTSSTGASLLKYSSRVSEVVVLEMHWYSLFEGTSYCFRQLWKVASAMEWLGKPMSKVPLSSRRAIFSTVTWALATCADCRNARAWAGNGSKPRSSRWSLRGSKTAAAHRRQSP